jgi:superfamily II DNA/RNA helicase
MNESDRVYVGYANGKRGCEWNEETSHTKSFRDFNLHPQLLENLMNLGELKLGNYISPTPIQEYALKPALAREDINCISATGQLLNFKQ